MYLHNQKKLLDKQNSGVLKTKQPDMQGFQSSLDDRQKKQDEKGRKEELKAAQKVEAQLMKVAV